MITLRTRYKDRHRINIRKKFRACLMCGRTFRSEGPHNRRCSRCNYLLEHAREGTYYEPTSYSIYGQGGSEDYQERLS